MHTYLHTFIDFAKQTVSFVVVTKHSIQSNFYFNHVMKVGNSLIFLAFRVMLPLLINKGYMILLNFYIHIERKRLSTMCYIPSISLG